MNIRLVTPIIAFAFLVAGCGDADPQTAEDSSDEQVIHVEATSEGFQPETITLDAEKPTRLIVTRTADSVCLEKMSIPAFNVEDRELPLDEPVEVTFTPTETGEFTFTCGMEMQDGTLVVEA